MIGVTETNGGAALISVKQAAGVLGISRRHLERLVAKGVFPRPMQLGRALRFSWDDVQAFMRRLNDERLKKGGL